MVTELPIYTYLPLSCYIFLVEMDYVCPLSKLIIYLLTFWFQNGYDAMQAQAMAAGYQGEWQDYQYAEQLAYPDQYFQQNMQAYEVEGDLNIVQDPRFMTQEEKDRGLGSVFKRDDQRLQQLREKDSREKDPNFISESYSECYPGYQEYNREIVDSDDEDDLSKMDMGGRVSDLLFCLLLLLLLFWNQKQVIFPKVETCLVLHMNIWYN